MEIYISGGNIFFKYQLFSFFGIVLMNVLDFYVPKQEEVHEEGSYLIKDFRKLQYDSIPNLIENSIKYLQKISNNKIVLKNIREQHLMKYLDAYGYSLKKIIINIEDPEDRTKEKQLMSFTLPELVKNTFFYLNGSYYTPALYILDKPITYKKNSIKLFSLMNSITLYFKVGNTRSIFGGRNIPIQYFLQWFLTDDYFPYLEELEEKFKIDSTRIPRCILTQYFSEHLNCEEDDDAINQRFYDLFFDDYTNDLYQKSYRLSMSFEGLVRYAIKHYLKDQSINFVDLKEKRLVFSEMLLAPFFRRIGDTALNIAKGLDTTSISFGESEVVKYFMLDMKHQYFYDLVNFYSGIQVMKGSFINPNMSVPPREISSVHASHFGRICPITISAKKPGESVSFVPTARVDKYGLFL